MEGRYTLSVLAISGAGLALLYAAAPARTDLLAAAAAGAGFAAACGISGFIVVHRAAGRSPENGIGAFLAVMTVKVIAFAAFLLTIAFTTQLNIAALAAGLAGATVACEALTIDGLRRMSAGGAVAGRAEFHPDGRAAENRARGRED